MMSSPATRGHAVRDDEDRSVSAYRRRQRVKAWGRNANVASLVVWGLGFMLGLASRGTEVGPYTLIGYALALPVCAVHIYVAASGYRRGEHILMALGTFFLTFLAMAAGRGRF